MPIPTDPAILLSYINTQLRDNYPSLDELSKSLSVDENEIKLAKTFDKIKTFCENDITE